MRPNGNPTHLLWLHGLLHGLCYFAGLRICAPGRLGYRRYAGLPFLGMVARDNILRCGGCRGDTHNQKIKALSQLKTALGEILYALFVPRIAPKKHNSCAEKPVEVQGFNLYPQQIGRALSARHLQQVWDGGYSLQRFDGDGEPCATETWSDADLAEL